MWAGVEAAARCWTARLPPSDSEDALILAPIGRDADVAARMLGEAGIRSRVCGGLPELNDELRRGAGLAVVTEEALATGDLRDVSAWIDAQPEWSDFPFVLLTQRGGGLERNPHAARNLRLLGNVTFVERPFHPTTLVSLAEAALRGRRRQYEARARLERLRESEAGLRDFAAELEARVEQRTRERELVEDALRQAQKMEAIGQLTGGVAHDFNNLLTVIVGSVELLRRDNLPEEKRRRYVDAIGTTADRATKLTRQLLAFARRQALLPELFDASASLKEVVGMVGTLAGSRVRLRLDVPDEPVFTRADRPQFDTAVVNMAINARDAMDGDGALTITIAPVSGIPARRAHPPVEGDYIAVSIADTGSGIAPEVIERIFEPFFTTKDVGSGTGLGLSQVIGFAKQSGGDVRVTSELGLGTTFTLYLPRATPEPRADQAAAPVSGSADGGGLCVLLVEDNEEVGRFATQALRELGYQSTLALDGEQALAKLRDQPEGFQIIFTDVVMPGISGVDLAKEVRRSHADLPVVLTSGYSHVLAQNASHGFELLHKPYTVEQLSRVLRRVAASGTLAPVAD